MGKGDKKTAKGKRYRGTYGKRRPKKGKAKKKGLQGSRSGKSG